MGLSLNKLLLAALLLTTVSASAQQPIVIDGEFDPAEWSAATAYKFPVNLPGGGTTSGLLYVANDASNLYFCVRVQEPAIYASESIVLILDANADGYPSAGDDEFGLSVSGYCYQPKVFTDEFFYSAAPCGKGSLCAGRDIDFGGTSDGNGAVGTDGTWTTYEIWHPLASKDSAHDVQWSTGKVGIAAFIRVIDASNVIADTDYPGPNYGTFDSYILQ